MSHIVCIGSFYITLQGNMTDSMTTGFQKSWRVLLCGIRVLVPFGRSIRMQEAFVMEIKAESSIKEGIKDIHQVVDEFGLTDSCLSFAYL